MVVHMDKSYFRSVLTGQCSNNSCSLFVCLCVCLYCVGAAGSSELCNTFPTSLVLCNLHVYQCISCIVAMDCSYTIDGKHLHRRNHQTTLDILVKDQLQPRLNLVTHSQEQGVQISDHEILVLGSTYNTAGVSLTQF